VRLPGGGELVAFAHVGDGPPVRVGDRIWATWLPEDVRVLPASGGVT
jgi:hypothetical protein